MGMFIKVEIDDEYSRTPQSKALVGICPVDIFEQDDGRVVVAPENEDECTLCNLCINHSPPDAIRIIKLYE